MHHMTDYEIQKMDSSSKLKYIRDIVETSLDSSSSH